jgi:hypothetical protein
MINLQILPTPIDKLGDRIIHCRFAHMFSVYNNVKVNLVFKSKEIQSIIDLFSYGDVTYNEGKSIKDCETIHINNDFSRTDFVDSFIRLIDEVPHIILDKKLKPLTKLPEKKYITTQWDAGGAYRLLSEDRIKKIESWYKEQGYDIINLTGDFIKTLPINEIATIIQGAELHVGVDSGMMHVARLVLPTEKIHMYVELKYRADIKTPNHENLSHLAIEAIRAGVKLNPIDNPPLKEAYSNMNAWYNFSPKRGYLSSTPNVFPYNTGKWKLGPEPKNFKHEGIPDISLY